MATFESRLVEVVPGRVFAFPVDRAEGEGTIPDIDSVEVIDDLTLRVHFTQPMTPNADLTTPGNYIITAMDGDSVAISVVSVETEPGDWPEYVNLTLDKVLTIGTSNYKIGAANVVSAAAIVISSDTVTFNGVCARAYIAATVFPGNLVKVRVTYSRPVKMVSGLNPDDALNTNNYTISGGVTVDDLDAVSSTVVDLVVIGMETAHTYVVTVENVEDTSNNEVA